MVSETHLRLVDFEQTRMEKPLTIPVSAIIDLVLGSPTATIHPPVAIDPTGVGGSVPELTIALPDVVDHRSSSSRKESDEELVENLVDDFGREGCDGKAKGRSWREEGEGGRASSKTKEGEEETAWLASLVGVDG